MKVVDMVLSTMKKGEYRTHYKKGNANYFLWNTEDAYFLDRVTTGCSVTVCCGDEEKVMNYIKENKMKEIQVLHV